MACSQSGHPLDRADHNGSPRHVAVRDAPSGRVLGAGEVRPGSMVVNHTGRKNHLAAVSGIIFCYVMMSAHRERQGGVQAVRRAGALLRALARAPASGSRLKDLAEGTGLDRATVLRLLRTLCDEGLVEQDAASRLYHLGLDFFSLAAIASNRYDIHDLAHEALLSLADELGGSVFFSLRSTHDAVCVDAHAGRYPLKTLAMDIGARLPLGAGATGIALLAALPDDEISNIVTHNEARLSRHGVTRERVDDAIQRFRQVGFAFDDGFGRLHAIAVALPDRRGRPLTAFTVAASPERMPLSRRSSIAAAIQAASDRVMEAMWRKPDALRHRKTWESTTERPAPTG